MMRRLGTMEIDSAVRTRLQRFLSTGRIPHFMLFHSGSEEFSGRVAHNFFLDWLGVGQESDSHVDLLKLIPEGKVSLHTVPRIKELLEQLSLAPYVGSKRAVLIRHMDRMLPASSNALLKALEEPSSQTIFIGTTQKPHRLLSTIRSRAHEVAIPISSVGIEDSVVVAKAVDLVLERMPLRSFSSLFSLCDELSKHIEKGVKSASHSTSDDEAVQFLTVETAKDAIVALRRSLGDTKEWVLAGEEALDALEKNTNLKDSFLLFFTKAGYPPCHYPHLLSHKGLQLRETEVL